MRKALSRKQPKQPLQKAASNSGRSRGTNTSSGSDSGLGAAVAVLAVAAAVPRIPGFFNGLLAFPS